MVRDASPRRAGVNFKGNAQKQHSSIAAQQAIRSPQQSEAAKAAPDAASSNIAAVRVVFIFFLLDEFGLAFVMQ